MRLLFFLLLFTTPVLAQTTDDCPGLLSRPLPYDTSTRQWDSGPLLEGTALLLACEFDEKDHALLVDWPFHNFLIELAVTDWQRQPTYRDMRDYFLSVQQTSNYRIAMGEEAAPVTFGTTLADTATWEQDIQLITGILPSQELMDDLYLLTIQYQGQDKTYGDLIDIYQASKDMDDTRLPDPFETIDGNSQEFAYQQALTQSKLQNKPLVLFFAGYGSMGSVKMTDVILRRQDVRKVLHKEFICLRLYADAVTELESAYRYQTNGDNPRTIRTVGQRNVDFQQQRFGTNFQPFFVILGPDDQELGRLQYTIDVGEFKAFLESATGND